MFGCSVRQAQQQISSREFAEWLAFDRLSPIGGERADHHAAQIVAELRNVNRTRRSQKVWEVGECQLVWGPKPKPSWPSWQTLKARMGTWLRGFRKHRKKKGGG